MNYLVLFSLLFTQTFAQTMISHEVKVPSISNVNKEKKAFIKTVSTLSEKIFKNKSKSALAPFGGTKITPFLELDLRELVIVSNSYPGTPAEIEKQFKQGSEKLFMVLNQSLRSGAMSTSDVLSVTNGAQLLSRLNLELGVKEVLVSYWVSEKSSVQGELSFSDRSMNPNEEDLATIFEFNFRGKASRLVFLSGFLESDFSAKKPGFPALLTSLAPADGFDWAYLSADGLAHFSDNRNNGLTMANQELLDSLSSQGAVLLDYPTEKHYHQPVVYGGITFMNGRRDLDEFEGVARVETIPVEQSGIFGYCLRPGDEVRVYQKSIPRVERPLPPKLRQVGQTHRWILN